MKPYQIWAREYADSLRKKEANAKTTKEKVLAKVNKYNVEKNWEKGFLFAISYVLTGDWHTSGALDRWAFGEDPNKDYGDRI